MAPLKPVCPDCQVPMVHLYERHGNSFASYGYTCKNCNMVFPKRIWMKDFRDFPAQVVEKADSGRYSKLSYRPDYSHGPLHEAVGIPSPTVFPAKCPNCGSNQIIKAGFNITKDGRKQRYRCKDCRKIFFLE